MALKLGSSGDTRPHLTDVSQQGFMEETPNMEQYLHAPAVALLAKLRCDLLGQLTFKSKVLG